MASDGVKKIMVNLDPLHTKSSQRKQTRKRPPPNVEPNRLKDTFIKQVQHYKSLANANKQKQKSETTPSKPLSAYTDEFNASVEYLNNIKQAVNQIQTELPVELIDDLPIAKVVEPKLVDAPLPPPPPSPQLVLQSSSSSYKVDNAVPYGCLKNGIKPSFKNWTRSNRPRPSVQMMSPTTNPSVIPMVPKSNTFSPTQPSIQSSQVHNTPMQPSVQPTSVQTSSVQANSTHARSLQKPRPVEKTIIRRHVIGKSKKSRHVGVLIKNVSTRKMITEEYKKLKKVNINEVKNQLKNNGLLKVGTTAPADILRQTYEASILAGLVKNNSEGTVYHNFMNEKNEENK